jgi:hypothetical protein
VSQRISSRPAALTATRPNIELQPTVNVKTTSALQTGCVHIEMMRTVSIFKNGNNRAIRLPRDLDFEGVSELKIIREGDSIILRPVRPT